MRIIVLGHPCLDLIHKDKKMFTSYGGIIYSLIGFLIVCKDADEIFPVFQIQNEHYDKYFEIISIYKQIKRNFIIRNESPINTVHLFFEGETLNFECYQSRAEKIQIEPILKLIPADSHLYINMISGFELELQDLELIRKNFTGKIYFDFHTLTRGINEEGRRFYRPIENWRNWVSNCDVIQLNESEMQNLTPENYKEEKFAEEALRVGCKIVNITKGAKGATTYFVENNSIKNLSYSPEPNLKFQSNVGCGDIFGAVFSYNYFRNEKIETCLKEAVKISSLRIEIENIENIVHKLKNNLRC